MTRRAARYAGWECANVDGAFGIRTEAPRRRSRQCFMLSADLDDCPRQAFGSEARHLINRRGVLGDRIRLESARATLEG